MIAAYLVFAFVCWFSYGFLKTIHEALPGDREMLELLKRIQRSNEESRQRSQQTIVELAEWSAGPHELRREKL